MLDDIFKNKLPVYNKLIDFGFVLQDNIYTFSTPIVDNQFILYVYVLSDGNVQTKVIDPLTQDEYTLHLANSAEGKFVGKVRTDYLLVLQKIAASCFKTQIFKSEYAGEIIQYVKDKYQNEFEYLWDKFPENAIVRRADNKKWYVLLMTVRKDKLNLPGDGTTEVVDLRMSPTEIERLTDNKKYLPGYHMNKKHWITICLDGSVALQEIFQLIDISYELAKSNLFN